MLSLALRSHSTVRRPSTTHVHLGASSTVDSRVHGARNATPVHTRALGVVPVAGDAWDNHPEAADDVTESGRLLLHMASWASRNNQLFPFTATSAFAAGLLI